MPQDFTLRVEQAAEKNDIKLCNNCHTRAMTSNGVVYLNPEWKESNIDDQCVLAHEAVHALQFVNDVEMTPAVVEPPAYFVQAICLAQNKGRDDKDIKFLVAQAAKYGYGHYDSSVK